MQEYLDVTKKHYSAEAQTCDFANDAAGSRSVINKWVEAQTNEKIKDLIPDGFINELTRLILVNAIYFKGIVQFYSEHGVGALCSNILVIKLGLLLCEIIMVKHDCFRKLERPVQPGADQKE